MIPITTFAGRKIAVFGLARSGLAAASALQAGGAKIYAWDDGETGRNRAHAQGIETKDLRTVNWSEIAALVLSPGVPLTHPDPHWTVKLAQVAGVEVIGDMELFFRQRAALGSASKVVAITGTNGKSTTTALVAHLLRQACWPTSIGGNIGEALLGLEPLADARVYVIELSSYQIDLTPSLKPTVSALLNISPDHLDRHGTIENYAAIKGRIFTNLDPGQTAVVSIDDDYCREIAQGLGRDLNVRRISAENQLSDGVYVDDGRLIDMQEGHLTAECGLNGIEPLRGRHNWQNACAAWAITHALGLEPHVIRRGLVTFPGLAHRMEIVGRRGNVLFVNDSKATNVEATAHALATFDDIYWIAGGRAKGGGIGALAEFFPNIRKAFLVGESAVAFSSTLTPYTATEISGTIAQAVADAANAAAASSSDQPVVLLSPACASFDQFPDFEARGDAYKSAVAEIDDIELTKGCAK